MERHNCVCGLETQHTKDVNSPQIVNRFNAIPIKSQKDIFVDIDKFIIKFILKGAESRIATTHLKKKDKIGGIILSNVKAY